MAGSAYSTVCSSIYTVELAIAHFLPLLIAESPVIVLFRITDIKVVDITSVVKCCKYELRSFKRGYAVNERDPHVTIVYKCSANL